MLNNEYFSALGLSLKKRKYYLASEVDEILSDIRSQAEALLNENARLKGQLDILNMNKDEIVETLNSAESLNSDFQDFLLSLYPDNKEDGQGSLF